MPLALVSHQHRFIFITLAKNASSTLRRQLKTSSHDAEERPYRNLSETVRKGYFTFAFVRDPLVRFLSAYQEISMRIEMRNDVPEGLVFATMPEGRERFHSFLGRAEESLWDPHIKAQADRLDGVRLDFLGRVEELQTDLATVYEKLEMGRLDALPRRRSRADRATTYNYDLHDLSPEDLDSHTIERIRTLYHRDVELVEEVRAGRYSMQPGQGAEIPPVVERPSAVGLWIPPELKPVPGRSRVDQREPAARARRGSVRPLTTNDIPERSPEQHAHGLREKRLSDCDRLFFLHLRKAAGTSIRTRLEMICRAGGLDLDVQEGGALDLDRFGDHRTFTVTCLREPVERVCSQYNFQGRWLQLDPDQAPETARSFEAWLAESLHRVELWDEPADYYTKTLAGHPTASRGVGASPEAYARARRSLDRFDLVLVSERFGFPAYDAWWTRRLGGSVGEYWQMPVLRRTQEKQNIYDIRDYMTTDRRATIVAQNRWDMELHKYLLLRSPEAR